jgi:hypothetical protein
MTRTLYPLNVADVSTFAKSLKKQLDTRHAEGKAPPTHVELLNMLAQAAGLRNFQTLRATAGRGPQTALLAMDSSNEPSNPPPFAEHPIPLIPPPTTQAAAPVSAMVRKALLQFDEQARLVRLPNKLTVQRLAMWWLWTIFEAGRTYTEREVNAILNAHHTFGDQATLRRELVNMKLLDRKPDCSVYWKEPAIPEGDAQDFLQAMQAARATPPSQILATA